MTADIISVRVLLVTPAASLRSVLRQGAAQAPVPAEVLEADGGSAAELLLAKGIDLVLLDSRVAAAEKHGICKTARSANGRPLIIAIGKDGDTCDVDGSVRKPVTIGEAQKIAENCVRARLPARVLIVDDSATLRGIVRRILSAGKFPVEVSDTDDGAKALEAVRDGGCDVMFLDDTMPGLNSLEVPAEIRRFGGNVALVMMTSTDNPRFARRALAAARRLCSRSRSSRPLSMPCSTACTISPRPCAQDNRAGLQVYR